MKEIIMGFNNVYCFCVHYGFDLDGWQEKDDYGFITANDFEGAYAQLKAFYGEDILSFGLEYIGDTGIVSIGDKELVKSFKQSFINHHYSTKEELEDEE
jgi:hypothetical protein